MKSLFTSFIFGGIIMIAVFTGCGKKPEKLSTPRPVTIIFFGDSVTYGYGVDTETESFFARINKIMQTGLYGDVVVMNAGVSGDDTSEALRRVTIDVTAHNPDYVVIAFGLNDCQNTSMTPQVFRKNINNMLALAPMKTRIILATSNTFLDTGQSIRKNMNDVLDIYMEELRKISREEKLTLIDVNTAWKNQIRQDQRHMESLYNDPTHPSPAGHKLIYETYMDVLRRELVK